ncbi:MAG: MerR family transcriptional regulator [Bacteroidia bacterium]|jgi:DNA-binding transcriptional MerR regulator|nr:MerR family transcriptional regulator [Bacteroidia bacterium]
MKLYTVKQLSVVSGVSVRTLHHYDEIGLLKPAQRTESRYRIYGREELLRLQQILFYRELGYSLQQIGGLLDDPDFDLLNSLLEQRRQLHLRAVQNAQLLVTIHKTINSLTNQKTMLTDEELYEGFANAKAYRQEAAEKWGEDTVSASEDKLRKMSRESLQALFQQGESIVQAIGASMHLPVESADVQKLIEQHYRHTCMFWDAREEGYRGLAEMYVSDERFAAYFNRFAPGLADYMQQAMLHYCKNGLK